MADVNVDLVWTKSPHFRAFNTTGQIVQVLDLGDGPKILMRFTTNWIDVAKESFVAQEIPAGLQQKTPSQYQMSPMIKIEEAAAIMNPQVAAGLIVALLQTVPMLPDNEKKIVKDALDKLPS